MKIQLFILIYGLFLENSILADTYTPNELFNVNYSQLPNGIEVYLQPRHHANNVSIRIAYRIGHKDFPCETRETAHYLEHLLFTGTSKHTEIELDELFKKYGGILNASTMNYQTTYETDVHSKYSISALRTYFEMLTDSTFTDDNIITTRNIIYREGGGKHTGIVRWLYNKNIFKHAINIANESIFTQDEYCRNLDYFDDISKQTILNAYKRYYVPNNMAIFIVGKFNKEKILKEVKNSFGKLISKPIKHRIVDHKYPEIFTKTVESSLLPLIGTEATVTFLFRVPGHKSKDKTTFLILTQYLSDEIFNFIRIERGLSYNPEADTFSDDSEGALSLSADIEVNDIEETIEALTTIISDIRSTKFSEKKLRELQEFYLLALAMGIESNSSLSDIYSSVWREFEDQGKFDDIELKIKSVTTNDIDRVTKIYLDPEKLIIAVDRPTLTYTQFFIIIGILFLVSSYIGIKIFRKNYKHI